MNLFALMPVRNEDWTLGLSLRAALLWCDGAVVLNHASTDRTAEILDEIQGETGRLIILNEPDATWAEMTHRDRMLKTAREHGATHVAIVDADEILTGNLLGTIRQHIETLRPGKIMNLPGYNLRNGLHQYHANGIWANRWFAFAFADAPELNWSGDRFHHREPMGMPLQTVRAVPHGLGGIMHLWGASERRLRAKHFLYQLTERIRWPEKSVAEIRAMYSLAVHGAAWSPAATWTFCDVPTEWWAPYRDMLPFANVDGEPWQIEYCRELMRKHKGIEKGFDSFGVI